jgi:hypothetical protein
MLRMRCLLVGLTLTLSGCLLPQPDTPVIPPYTGSQTVAAPAQAPTKDAAPAQAPVPATAPAAGSADQGLISNNAGGLVSNNAGGMISNNAGGLISNGTAPATTLAPGAMATVKVRVTGMTVVTLIARPEDPANTPSGVDATPAGDFILTISPGTYHLEVMLADGKVLVVGSPLVFAAGETRSLTLKLQENPPTATISEDAPLVAPSPEPTPSKAP